jgi:hypothetical protein
LNAGDEGDVAAGKAAQPLSCCPAAASAQAVTFLQQCRFTKSFCWLLVPPPHAT